MTPEALLEKLESLGTIDANVLRRLRKTVENPEKDSSVNKILSYLVKNDLLSREQAQELKRESDAIAEAHVDMHDSDDLTAGILDPEDVADEEIETPEQPEDIVPVPATPVDTSPVDTSPEVAAQPRDPAKAHPAGMAETVINEPVEPVLDDVEAYDDPMAESLDQFTDTKHVSRGTFAGKIDARDQWATKWIFIGFSTLGFLLIAGTLLVFFLSMISAVERFDAATQSFEDGTYGDAIKKFEEFIEKHPNHEKIPLAKVKLVQALLADTFKQRNWDETIVRAEKHLPPLLQDDNIDLEPIRQDLAVILPNTALEMAKRATKQDTKTALVEQLDKAKNAKKLVDNPVYVPNSKRKQAAIAKVLDDIEEEIAKGDGLIQKQKDFDEAMVQIAAFRLDGQTDRAFETYNQLIRDYGDLRANQQLQNEMRQVSQLESKLVQVIRPDIASATSVRNSPVKSSVILASKHGTPIESLRGEIVPYLVDGAVFGVDVGDGSVIWRHHVGYQSDIEPIHVDEKRILISDLSKNDLLLVSATDGTLNWRNEIGEPFLPPQVDEGQILLTTNSGKLMRMDLESGQVTAASQIPQIANIPMIRSPRTETIIQPGFYSNLYVLSAEDLTCQDVFYLGHNRGSIGSPPVVWNNMILVPVNQSGVCDLNVLGPSEDGSLQLVQRIRRVTRGIVSNPLVRFGRFMLITSESGDIKILELNTADEKSPVRILAEEKFENSGGARIHLTTAGSQLWIGARGVTRYKVSRALGVFERQKFANTDDYFIGPIRRFGDAVVHLRKRSGSALSSVAAVDGMSLEEIWRTDFGGPLAGSPIVSGNRVAAITSQGDLFAVNDTANSNADRLAVASSISEELIFQQVFDISPTQRACLGPPGAPDLLFIDIVQGASRLLRLPPPADDATCPSIQIGTDLIIPSRQGQVLRINPANGQVVGTPFLPAVRPGNDVNWQKPAVIGGSYFVIAADQQVYLIDATDDAILKQVGELATEGAVKSQFAAATDRVYTIVSGKPTDKLISISAGRNGLQPGNSVDLGGIALSGPWVVGNDVLLRMSDNSLVSFDANLTKKWSMDVGAGLFGGNPVLDGGNVRLIFSDGRIHQLDPQNGSLVSQSDLGQPVVHQPVATDGGYLFSGRDGTIHFAELTN